MPPFSDQELDIKLAAAPRPEPQEPSEGSLTVDVFRDEGDVVIQSTIAGAVPSDIDISILDNMVTIRGTRQPDTKVRQSDYYYQELYWGSFSRSIILPETVDPDGAKASFKNGILTVRLPTLEKAKTRRLKVELK
jgi:HSP20 family protein